jgi:SAM-dependent methyltransferase
MSSADNFQEHYSDLKNWDINSFGELKSSTKRYFFKLLKKTKKELPPNSNVLEIGFGNGSFLEYSKQRSWNINGTEVNLGLVEIAAKKGFLTSQTSNLNLFQDNSFDLVVALDVLEHIEQEQILHFLMEVKRVLKTDGVFLARFPSGDSPFGLATQNGDITHIMTIGTGKIKHFVNYLNVKLVYAGADVELIFRSNPFSTVRNIFGFFAKMLINFFIYLIFHRKNFCSTNLVMIFKKE